jgi:hypothetical protein
MEVTMALKKADLDIRPGDRVLYGTAIPGLSPGGSCRRFEKVVASVDDDNDTVHFTDGTTYNHIENPGMTLELIGEKRPVVLIP